MIGRIAKRVALAVATPLQRLMPRMTPRLVIIGAQKAGTTTLYDLLAQHPRIIQPRKKEVSFFCSEDRYVQGFEHYLSFFPPRPVLDPGCITFDASPMYLYHARCAERIAQHLPDAICLVLLRDPVERAYSAWNMYHQFGADPRYEQKHDPRTFEQAVADELAGKPTEPAQRYLDRGRYVPQLERYIQYVGRDRLIIEEFDRLKSDAPGLVNDLLARLGLDPMPNDHPAFATRSNARSYSAPLDPALAAQLKGFFAEDQRALKDLLATFQVRMDR